MTTTTAAAAPTATIDFPVGDNLTRTMRVKLPTPEQLAVWRRTVEWFERAGDNLTGEPAQKALGRIVKIIMSVLADDADIEWVEDQLLDGQLTAVRAADILTLTVDQFADQAKNKAPKNGPVKKTTPRARARATR